MNIGRLSDGTLVALYRSRWADAVYRSVSTDDGDTWTEPEPTELPNNNSSIQFVVLPDDRLALVFNESSAADATARRTSLYDEIDDDGLADERPNGAAEPQPLDDGDRPHRILGCTSGPDDAGDLRGRRPEPGRPAATSRSATGTACPTTPATGVNREYSYPSDPADGDGVLHVAFTRFRQAIEYVELDQGSLGDGSQP